MKSVLLPASVVSVNLRTQFLSASAPPEPPYGICLFSVPFRAFCGQFLFFWNSISRVLSLVVVRKLLCPRQPRHPLLRRPVASV